MKIKFCLKLIKITITLILKRISLENSPPDGGGAGRNGAFQFVDGISLGHDRFSGEHHPNQRSAIVRSGRSGGRPQRVALRPVRRITATEWRPAAVLLQPSQGNSFASQSL